MARGVALGTLLTRLRSEAQISQNVAHNQLARDEQVNLLQRMQEWLWEDYAWDHLRVRRPTPNGYAALSAGQRTISPPADMRVDRIEKIEIRFGGLWCDLKPGIDASHYAIHDSDLDQRMWPVERWRIDENEQIELWPISSMNGDATTLEAYYRITGIRNLNPLVDDDDTADIDDRLLTLYAASELLSAKNPALAGVKQKAANSRLRTLRGNMQVRRKMRLFGSGDTARQPKGPPTTYYRTDS